MGVTRLILLNSRDSLCYVNFKSAQAKTLKLLFPTTLRHHVIVDQGPPAGSFLFSVTVCLSKSLKKVIHYALLEGCILET